jgi:two-component system response regulator RegX3
MGGSFVGGRWRLLETLTRASVEVADPVRSVPDRIADTRSGGTILLIEVEPLLMDSIKYTLERDGHRILVSPTREAGLAEITIEHPRLVLAEFPQISSEIGDFCRKARALSAAPLILITPDISDGDRNTALGAGADDLLAKPFSLREVAQRVSAHMHRAQSAAKGTDHEDEILRVGPVEMDVANHEVRVRGQLILFPPKEFALLEALLRSRGRLVRRDQLIGTVWGANYFGDGKTLDTHVKRLRKKIERDPRKPLHLVVVRGMGFRFLER